MNLPLIRPRGERSRGVGVGVGAEGERGRHEREHQPSVSLQLSSSCCIFPLCCSLAFVDDFLCFSRRVSRARVTRTSTQHRSIAETEGETDTGAEGEEEEEESATSHSHSGEESNSGEDTSRSGANQYYTGSGFTRSPYVTRSTSKTRTSRSAYKSSTQHPLSSPTKTLSFNEDEEDRVLRGRHVPPTPGEIDAHDDADVYMQDCCDSHEVKRPDGSIIYRRHAHGTGHSHANKTTRTASDSATPRSSGLVWYVVLSMLLLSLLGPWALNQLTHRPPSFVAQKGQEGGVITQGQNRDTH